MGHPLAPLDRRLAWRYERLMPLDLSETDQAYRMTVELPGYTRDDISVSLDGARVTIRVGDDGARHSQAGTPLCSERALGPRSRTVVLGQEVDKENAHGACRDGVLTLHLPKRGTEADVPPDAD